MIKHLPHLKVRAIAVEVPEGEQLFSVTTDIIPPVLFMRGLVNIQFITTLPPGTWSILGRASELTNDNLFLLFPWYAIRDKEWQSYCAEHGLTNELILISP